MSESAPTRHIEFEGCTNFRDLGGYRTADGRITRWRTLFRSGDPSLMTPGDMERARALDISTVIDFRGGSHIRLLVSPLSQEVRSYRALAFEPAWVDFGPHTTWPDTGLSYMRHPNAQAQLRAGIEALAGDSGLPAVFHCAQGKDRTGMFAAIILGSLGVAETDIAADFGLSARHYEVENFRAVVAALAAQGGEGAELAKRGARILAVQAESDQSGPETMLAFLEGVRSEYGSMRSYALGIGVAEKCLAKLEENLLESDGATAQGIAGKEES